MGKKVWTDEYTIQSLHIDFSAKAKLTSICRFFQESAWRHASEASLGYHDLLGNNHAWVLYKLKLRINDFPEWSDKIYLTTWAKKTDRVFAYRDFEIRSSIDNNLLIYGTSKWVILDIHSKRPRRMDQYASLMPLNEQNALSDPVKKIPPVNSFDRSSKVTVKYSDIDLNHHVNNVKYLEWILDMYDINFFIKNTLSEFEIDYMNEAGFNDEINLKRNMNGIEHIFSATAQDSREIFRAKIKWKSKHQQK